MFRLDGVSGFSARSSSMAGPTVIVLEFRSETGAVGKRTTESEISPPLLSWSVVVYRSRRPTWAASSQMRLAVVSSGEFMVTHTHKHKYIAALD